MRAMNDPVTTTTRPWWGTFPILRGQGRRWRVGPLTLWIDNPPAEWRVAWSTTPEPDADAYEVATAIDAMPDDVTLHRFASPRDESAVRLVPRAPDRPMVARPEMPISVLGGESVDLFTSVPVWVCVQTAKADLFMVDIPTFRASDTWFGPSTREGQLCYAMRTRARLSLDGLPRPAWRALVKVTLRNHGADALAIERISVPTPSLAVFAAEDGGLWLPGLTLERDADGEVGRLRVDAAPPAEAGPTKQVGAARDADRANVLVRTLGWFWR
jgi:hypothetical protein